MLNKKGTDKMLSMYWFAILIIIAGAIFAMVALFYGYPYDVRNVEANIMVNQVSDCLSNNGEIDSGIIFSKDFSLLDNCNLNFDVEKDLYNKFGNYYLEVNFYNMSDGEKVIRLSEGNPSFISDCKIKDEDYNKLSYCLNRTFYSVDKMGNSYSINVLSIINKVDKNVK